MNNNDTEELFIYLNSARPFKLKCMVGNNGIFTLDSIYGDTLSFITENNEELCINYKNVIVKPYLRSLESLNEKELSELDSQKFSKEIEILRYYDANSGYYKCTIPEYKQIDWLNKNHVDYRNFIKRGMAIEITDKNNPYV